jgi:chaperone modulatory protein CbpM
MNGQTGITLRQVCEYFHVDIGIVLDFAEYGLYPTVTYDGEIGIETRDLDRVKRILCLHQALGINKEGIEVILTLDDRIDGLQREVQALRGEVERLKRQSGAEEPEALRRIGLLIEIGE